MKKLGKIALFLLSIPLIAGCTENGSSQTEPVTESNPKIALTLNNYSDYIATYSYVIADNYTYRTYWNFYGSSICKFFDPVVYYTFQNKEQTCKLTISGCGQILAGASGSSYDYSATITNITGYVQVLF